MDDRDDANVALVDDEFERLGQRAGAELRLQPPAGGPGIILRSAHRRRATVAAVAAGATVAIVVTGLFVANSLPQDEPAPIATVPPTTVAFVPTTGTFVGIWRSTDTDGSSQTMEIGALATDDYEVVVRDEAATGACSGAPSTMVGSGQLATDDTLVIARPELTCDDATTPVIGPPPQAELADFTFVHDPATDELVDRFGVVWRRDGSNDEPIAPSPVAVPGSDSATSGGMWPQSTLDEVRAAQELADAEDPAYTWQLDAKLAADEEPWGAEIFARFIDEELGWEDFAGTPFAGYAYGDGGGRYESVLFIRCAPGQTNPLAPVYADAPPEIRRCAPTIDELTYESVGITVTQPAGRGPSGIWVVDRWEMRQSKYDPSSLWGLLYPEFDRVEQVVPPSDAEVTAFLEGFLRTRLDGEGADEYLLHEPEESGFPDQPVPLLYATTSGAPYQRSEIQRLQGPVWPNGWTEYKVRLFAEDQTVVEQRFHVVRHDGQLGLVYGYTYGGPDDGLPTTENGQSVAVPYSFLDGEVTFAAAPPWNRSDGGDPSDALIRLNGSRDDHVVIATDPLPAVTGCEDTAPADAEALARRIMADPHTATIGTVPARIAGLDALQMDVDINTNAVVSTEESYACTGMWAPDQSDQWRMRLYLIDFPGESAQVLAVAVIAAPATDFVRVLEEAMPIVESLEFHIDGEA